MKKIFKSLCFLSIAFVFTGCYKHTPKEAAAPADVKEGALDIASPSKEEADVIIITHVKKRQTEDSYTFTFFVDGKEIKESVKGEKEKEDADNDKYIPFAGATGIIPPLIQHKYTHKHTPPLPRF